ncbi:MAG: hypothetical protein Q9166_000933 [cf. Caloplaca sp. 2 TL-2023]
MGDWACHDLVDQLTLGFGALLDQVQELDQKNAHLEHLLDRMQEQIWSCFGSGDREPTYRLTFAHHYEMHSPILQVMSADEGSFQIRVNDPTISTSREHNIAVTHQTFQPRTTEDSGLYIECVHNQLQLRSVPQKIKWLITDGVKAWNTLRSGGIGQRPYVSSHTAKHHKGPTSIAMAKAESSRCPFTALQPTASNPHEPSISQDGLVLQDQALPDGVSEDPIAADNQPAAPSSHAASQTGSVSKCPIRFLDQHSPEEVAEYFTNHRHEIPRSHEICVKRYQRNEDQIRLLDHKYGSLVNMIQGLGQKHQPMLHTKSGEENVSQDRASQDVKVEVWAQEVEDSEPKAPEVNEEPVDDEDRLSERKGHFDRPLKEIRVGESPSRPWGISVPQGAQVPPSAVGHDGIAEIGISHPPGPPTPPTASPAIEGTKSPFKASMPMDRQPSMVFTGPVFIGYAPDQIADILQRSGLGKAEGR